MDALVECFCLANWVQLGSSLLLFVGFYLFYRILFFGLNRVFKKAGFAKKFITYLRRPTLVVFIEIAGIISINILGIKELYEDVIRHVISILMIVTVGWVLAAMLKAIYVHTIEKHEGATLVDFSKRSLITQVTFIYRAAIFLIIVLSGASILLTFPQIKSIGIGLLGSAGIVGIALGIAARPILLNLMAGFQIAFTKTIKIEDAIIVEGEFARIESIHLTHVVARTWDLRRVIFPISYFIDNPFQNWSTHSAELIGTAFLYCDFTVPVEEIRKQLHEILKGTDLWNGKLWKMQVVDITEQTLKIRMLMTADDPGVAFELRCYVREKMIDFIKREFPESLPHTRYINP